MTVVVATASPVRRKQGRCLFRNIVDGICDGCRVLFLAFQESFSGSGGNALLLELGVRMLAFEDGCCSRLLLKFREYGKAREIDCLGIRNYSFQLETNNNPMGAVSDLPVLVGCC